MGEVVRQDGVTIPTEIVKQSEEKRQQHRTVRQTQVYRDMANLKYLIAKYMGESPRRYAKYFDSMLLTASNAKQSLALGLIVSDVAQKHENMTYAQVMIEDIQDDALILNQLGIISKEQKKGMRKLAQKVAGQIVRLRDYYKSQGININGSVTK